MLDGRSLVDEVRRELARLPPILNTLLGDLDDATWRARPATDEWAPVEIVCHLRDEEVEDFGARVSVVLAGGTAFSPIDPECWAVDRRYGEADPAGALAGFRRARRASLDRLCGASPAALARAVDHAAGPLTGLDLLAAWVAHDRLHLAQLAATLARLGADRWAPLRAEYAGPIPYGADAHRALTAPGAAGPGGVWSGSDAEA
jgi:hypothetical protein